MGLTSLAQTRESRSLIARCGEGQDAAFEEVFRLYGPDIYRVARRMTGNHDDADDVLQDTFVKAFERIHEVDRDANIRRWLLTIAINTCIDRRRRRRLSIVELTVDPPSDEGRPDRVVLAGELNAHLERAIGMLKGRQKACFVLHELEEMKVTDVAATLGCSTGAVKSYLHRARETLRAYLGPYLGPTS
jgi:RNA polymerase sigma-70 factor (ECF subfamily)